MKKTISFLISSRNDGRRYGSEINHHIRCR